MTKLLSRLIRFALPLALFAIVFNGCNAPTPQPQQRQAFGVALSSTARVYPPGGTCEIERVYHVNKDRDKILRDLGYTEQAAKDSFPTFAAYWQARGWPTSELLDLYEIECASNDWTWHVDTYIGIGIYIRPEFVTQSRAWIKYPDGWYRLRYGIQTGLGRYSGKHAQVYSDRSGANPGCTPGTCFEIDHAGWSKRQADRVCLNSTAWGKDYSVIGGIAYTEGIIIENIRMVGNKSQCPAGVMSTGVTLNEPGENSVIRECMSENFKGAGYTIFNGTPFVVSICSAFNNDGPGFDHLGSNGLCNVTWYKCSGDNNVGGLIKFRPKDAQSVGGGTHQVIGEKSEARGMVQVPIVVEGKMGDMNLTVDGMTANCEGATLPYLIGGNWSGTQFEINARGIDLRSNTQALAYQGGTGLTVKGGKPYSGNSFVWNDEGLAFKSRANMTLTTGTTPPPDGTWTCGAWSACTNGTQTRTCTCSGNCPTPPSRTETQACTTPPVSGLSMTAWDEDCTEAGAMRVPSFAVDGQSGTFWMGCGPMTSNGSQWVVVTLATAASKKGLTFTKPSGYNDSWPRTFTVELSTNGTTFGAPKSYTGNASQCVATWTAQTVKAVRIKCTAANGNYWGISEVSFQ